MKKYIQPSSEVIAIQAESHLLGASTIGTHDEVGGDTQYAPGMSMWDSVDEILGE